MCTQPQRGKLLFLLRCTYDLIMYSAFGRRSSLLTDQYCKEGTQFYDHSYRGKKEEGGEIILHRDTYLRIFSYPYGRSVLIFPQSGWAVARCCCCHQSHAPILRDGPQARHVENMPQQKSIKAYGSQFYPHPPKTKHAGKDKLYRK